jgi:hypothetical protein
MHVDIVCHVEGKGPKVSGDCLGPAMLGVHQHSACRDLEIANALLGESILKMGVDASKGYRLMAFGTVIHEGVVGEMTIVGMVVLDGHAMGTGVGFEGTFGLDGFFSVSLCL